METLTMAEQIMFMKFVSLLCSVFLGITVFLKAFAYRQSQSYYAIFFLALSIVITIYLWR